MRDSPLEVPRGCPAPQASSSTTRAPRRARCHAVHPPNAPAPITATSAVLEVEDWRLDVRGGMLDVGRAGRALPARRRFAVPDFRPRVISLVEAALCRHPFRAVAG